jgi:hypothetical protein
VSSQINALAAFYSTEKAHSGQQTEHYARVPKEIWFETHSTNISKTGTVAFSVCARACLQNSVYYWWSATLFPIRKYFTTIWKLFFLQLATFAVAYFRLAAEIVSF